MNWKKKMTLGASSIAAFALLAPSVQADEHDDQSETTFLELSQEPILSVPEEFPSQFKYDSGVEIDYPEDGVKGIFVTGYSAAGQKMDSLVNMLNDTDLNSMVIDVKDDHGNLLMPLGSDVELINESTQEVIDPETLMNTMEENDIYPIARVVVFKDTKLATARPELSFTQNGEVWKNGRNESFVNPYEREVWEYNVEVAKQAAKLGFKEIQFDYVRFPEGFENRDEELNYSRGEYADSELNNIKSRVEAVTDFVSYANQELQPYDVDVSVDIFGYAATVEETPGIGQNFSRISENVDVISAMIYPSHWGVGSLGIDRPDLEPYNVVDQYMTYENDIFAELGEEAPTSRPWLQDFTASYLGSGYYKQYGAKEVEDQIRALNDHGVNEFLLWNAGNVYSDGAQYSFE